MTDRATARASASSRAPVTEAVISVAAPSPSAACWRARSRATASIAAPRAVAAGEPAPTGATPAAPDARTKTVSFVLVSPSTESWSQVRAAAGRSRPHRTSGATVASVSTTDSIVAIRGWIIPTPLAIPLTVTRAGRPSLPGSSRIAVATLVFESVVRRATAAASSPSSDAASTGTRAASPAPTLSSGSRVPMTPVERWSVRSTVTPVVAASIAAISAWSASPAAPVAAFALPLVEMTASAQPNPPRGSPDVAARCARDSRTGAAANAFGVKTAATAAGPVVESTTARSGRPEALIPAARPPALKPAGMTGRRSTGGRSAEDVGTGRSESVVMGRAGAARGRPSRAGHGRG